jgi:hypothetical protein
MLCRDTPAVSGQDSGTAKLFILLAAARCPTLDRFRDTGPGRYGGVSHGLMQQKNTVFSVAWFRCGIVEFRRKCWNPAKPYSTPHARLTDGFQRLRLWWGVQGGNATLAGFRPAPAEAGGSALPFPPYRVPAA